MRNIKNIKNIKKRGKNGGKKQFKIEHVILFFKLSASTTPFASTILQLHQTCIANNLRRKLDIYESYSNTRCHRRTWKL